MLATLNARANNSCEFCDGADGLAAYPVGPAPDNTANTGVLLCATCRPMIEGDVDQNHMRCLGGAIWSEHDPVKVLAWRLLNRLSDEAWARDLTDQMYMDDAALNWAKSGVAAATDHKDSNGVPLLAGDTVVLIKDLPVKGGGFTAKRGTAVHRISLVQDVPEHIEGRVEGQRIVILTEYVKKRL